MLKITKTGKKVPVYDIHVKNNHNFIANNLVVHNCTEILEPVSPGKYINIKRDDLPKYKDSNINILSYDNSTNEFLAIENAEISVCNLGSIVLGNYVKDNKVDKAKLRKNVDLAVRFLDKVIDINFYPVPEAEQSNKKWRPVGLGIMGLQDLFFKLKLPFESIEAVKISAEIQEEIYYQALKTSNELAKELGPHRDWNKTHAAKGLLQFDLAAINDGAEPKYKENGDLEEYIKNGEKYNFQPKDHARWNELKKQIKEHGLRNSLLVAVAPTACQVGTNKIRTEVGTKSIYQILSENDINFSELEKNCHQMWLPLKPFNVPTLNGLQEANKIWYNGPQKVYKITYEDGSEYEYTGNHKLLVRRNNEEIWCEVQYLEEDDDIVSI